MEILVNEMMLIRFVEIIEKNFKSVSSKIEVYIRFKFWIEE